MYSIQACYYCYFEDPCYQMKEDYDDDDDAAKTRLARSVGVVVTRARASPCHDAMRKPAKLVSVEQLQLV